MAQTPGSPRWKVSPEGASAEFPWAEADHLGLSSQALSRLGDSVAAWVGAGQLVGAEILVIKEGRTVLHEAVGWSDREEGRVLQPNSIFRIRSMSKPMIGTAVLMLADAGRLSLDDAVSDYLPSFDNPRARSIRIREVLTHTSGLGNHAVEDIGLPKEAREYDSLRELVDDIGRIGPTRARGTFYYSDSGSATLAALVAEVSGMPAERFLETRLTQPLGMVDTRFEFAPDSSWAHRTSSTYQWSRETQAFERYWDPSEAQVYRYFRGTGGVYSTPKDYALFLDMWMKRGSSGQGEPLLSSETVEEALRPWAGGQYGFHWRVPETPITDGMPAVFLHGGMDNTLAVAFPGLDAMVLFFTQSRGPGVRERFRSLLGRLPSFSPHMTSDDLSTTVPERLPTPVPLSRTEAARYVGSYSGEIIVNGREGSPNGFTYQVWLDDGSLRGSLVIPGGLPFRPSPGHDLIHLGGGRFVPGRVHEGDVVEVRQGFWMQFSGSGGAGRVELTDEAGGLRWLLERDD